MSVIISNATLEIELLESINKTLDAIWVCQLFVIFFVSAITTLLLLKHSDD